LDNIYYFLNAYYV